MMKAFKFLFLSFVLSSVMAVSALAARPIRSLNDLPFKWEGSAGDLLTRAPATFTIDRIVKATHLGDGKELHAEYEVAASLELGARTLSISKVTLRSYSYGNGESIEVFMHADDEHVFAVQAMIRYDETTNTFTLAEIPHAGVRRFVLTAEARK